MTALTAHIWAVCSPSMAMIRDDLAAWISRENNVHFLGEPADPKLPDNSFDRILMVHMYHEIEAPYEFLWRMRPSLKADGVAVVVDADDSVVHAAEHEPAGNFHPNCRMCQLRAVYRQTTKKFPRAHGRERVLRAVGIAVPAIEAW